MSQATYSSDMFRGRCIEVPSRLFSCSGFAGKAVPKIVVLFSRDPGGANTIIPLVKPLWAKGYRPILLGKDIALDSYRRTGLAAEDLVRHVNPISVESLERFLKDRRADVLVTGTSAEDSTEKYFWKAAENLGVPSLAILDQWVNYGIRFSPYGVSRSEQYERDRRHPFLPTRILVMDAFARAEMLEELGIPESDRVMEIGKSVVKGKRVDK